MDERKKDAFWLDLGPKSGYTGTTAQDTAARNGDTSPDGARLGWHGAENAAPDHDCGCGKNGEPAAPDHDCGCGKNSEHAAPDHNCGCGKNSKPAASEEAQQYADALAVDAANSAVPSRGTLPAQPVDSIPDDAGANVGDLSATSAFDAERLSRAADTGEQLMDGDEVEGALLGDAVDPIDLRGVDNAAAISHYAAPRGVSGPFGYGVQGAGRKDTNARPNRTAHSLFGVDSAAYEYPCDDVCLTAPWLGTKEEPDPWEDITLPPTVPPPSPDGWPGL